MYDQWESILPDTSIMGAEISTWCGANEYLYALNDHFLSILFSQNILWSGRTLPINEVYEHLSIRMPEVRTRFFLYIAERISSFGIISCAR